MTDAQRDLLLLSMAITLRMIAKQLGVHAMTEEEQAARDILRRASTRELVKVTQE